MYAQTDTTAPSSSAVRPTTSRATLRTRPRIQRTLIRSWEYIQPVRVTILVIRLLVVLWLVSLGAVLLWPATPGAGLCYLPPRPCSRLASGCSPPPRKGGRWLRHECQPCNIKVQAWDYSPDLGLCRGSG